MPERPRTGVRAVGGKESGEEEERPREEKERGGGGVREGLYLNSPW